MAASRTITQRIALDGGAQIISDLTSIGKAAQSAFEKFSAVTSANNFLGRFGTSVDAVSAKVKALQVAGGNVGNSFNGFTSSVGGVATKVSLVTAAVGGLIGGFLAMIKSAGDAQEALQNTADTLGVAAEKYQALQQAAELSGVGGDQLSKALLKQVGAMNTAITSNTGYNKSLEDVKQKLRDGKIGYQDYLAEMAKVNQESDKTATVFEKLGVSISDNGKTLRDPLEVFHDISDAFKAMPDGANKASLAMQIWGTRNAKLTAFANAGADGIHKMTLEAQRLTPALDKNGREALDHASDALKVLGDAAGATKDQILAVFAPDVSALVEAYTNVVANSRAAWVSYAKTLEEQVKPIVQDVIAVIEGRDQDVKNTFVLKARDAIIDFANAVQNAVTNIIIPAFNGFLAVLQVVADGVNAVFGTQLTGGQIAIAAAVASLTGVFGALGGAITLVVSVIGLLVTAFGGAVVATVAAGLAIGALLGTLAANLPSIGEVADRVFRGIPILAQAAMDGVVSAFEAGVQAVTGLFTGLADTARSIFDSIMAGVQAVANAISGAISGSGSSGDAPAFAGGGEVRGPGTGTSDSIRAWLSNGEFVQPTMAVNKYGLAFMNAIKLGRISVDRVRDLMSGVDLGSLGAVMPNRLSFATGGLATVTQGGGNSQAVNLHFGDRSFPLQGTPDVVRDLSLYASGKNARSAGRKPTWFGGGK
jgi:hypothetical protein